MTEQKEKWAIGLMSGTSGDGIDISIINTDGETIKEEGERGYYPYAESFREKLKTCFGQSERTSRVKEVELELTTLHSKAVNDFLHKLPGRIQELNRSAMVIGFHGQTIYNNPALKTTIQLGDGQMLAASTGIDVVCDFRQNDLLHGGQGAPLVPVYHHAL